MARTGASVHLSDCIASGIELHAALHAESGAKSSHGAHMISCLRYPSVAAYADLCLHVCLFSSHLMAGLEWSEPLDLIYFLSRFHMHVYQSRLHARIGIGISGCFLLA